MRKFMDYTTFAKAWSGPYAVLKPGPDWKQGVSFVGQLLIDARKLHVRDARLYPSKGTFLRLEHPCGLQVLTGWNEEAKPIVGWTMTSDDIGSFTNGERGFCGRTIDFTRRLEQVYLVAEDMFEHDVTGTLDGLGLVNCAWREPFRLTLANGGSEDIAAQLARIDKEGIGDEYDMFADEDSREDEFRKMHAVRFFAALGGNVWAMRELAWWFDPENTSIESDIKQNEDIAMYWYARAAEKGDAMAANNLAVCYMGRHDCANAIRWFRASAHGGQPEAKESLMRCLKCRMEKGDKRGPRMWAKSVRGV